MKNIKKIVKYIITFIILLIIFNLLLSLSSLFPSSLIEKNVKESSITLMKEGNLYQFFGWLNIYNDNYTDSIMINTAYSIDYNDPVYSYMSGRKNFKNEITKTSLKDTSGELISVNNLEEYDPVGELDEFLDGNINTSINYARYWHGYLPILRILLLIFNISEIRIFLFIIFFILFVYLLYLLKNKLGIIISFIFGISLILHGYFFVSYSLQNAPVFLVMMISCIILLNNLTKIKDFYLFL